MKYPREEIWERKAYEEDIRKKKLTTLFRPENRICDGKKKKCFCNGEKLILRVLEIPGKDKTKSKPIFVKNLTKLVKVKSIKKRLINSLTKEDFRGSYPNIKTVKELKYYLGLIYNRIPSSFSEVTKIKIQYMKPSAH